MAITGTAVTAAANTLTPTFTFGFTASAGDLIVFPVACDSAITAIAWPGSWVELRENAGTGFRAAVAYLKAAGGETSVSPTGSGTADRWEGVIFRIPAAEWHGTTAPESVAPVAASTANPNPPTITASWGAEAANIFAAFTMRDDSVANTISAYPTNYSTAQTDSNATTSAANCGGAFRVGFNSASDDPGTFTISATEDTLAYTIVIRGPAGGATLSPAAATVTASGKVPVLVNSLAVPAAALTITGQVPVLVTSFNLVPASKSLPITTSVPALKLAIAPAAAAVTVTGRVPVLVTALAPAAATVTVTGRVPGLTNTIRPAAAAVTISTFVPTITITSGGATLVPARALLTVTTNVPVVTGWATVLVPAAAGLTLLGKVPVVDISPTPYLIGGLGPSGGGVRYGAGAGAAASLHPIASVRNQNPGG